MKHTKGRTVIYWILNSAVIGAGAEGVYSYRVITYQAAARWLRAYPDAVSRIGYEQNAAILSDMAGREIEVSRDLSDMQTGDIALVMRLPYRVANPATKGASVNADDFEYAIFKKLE